MENKDIELLWMFTLRIEMYTGKENAETISSFLNGYEIGRNNECQFISELMDAIEQEFDISPKATGWVGQIERVAEKENSDWVTIFKAQSLKLLAKSMNYSIKENLLESIKRRVIGKTSGAKNHFRKDWITDWFGIIHLDENWFNACWTSREIELMQKIERELNTYGAIAYLDNSPQPSSNVLLLCNELYELIRR